MYNLYDYIEKLLLRGVSNEMRWQFTAVCVRVCVCVCVCV